MRLSDYGTYLVVPLHLAAGCLFGLLPATPHNATYFALYSAIVLLLVLTLVVYGMLVYRQRPRVALIWVQCGAALLAAALPLFCLDFSSVWHILMYPLFLGGSLFACLLVGNAVVLTTRN